LGLDVRVMIQFKSGDTENFANCWQGIIHARIFKMFL